MNHSEQTKFFSPAGTGGNHRAGATRPKAETAQTLYWGNRPRQNCVNKRDKPDTAKEPLGMKLRRQAAILGYKPGSQQWRAYVLGTLAAARAKAAKRKRR